MTLHQSLLAEAIALTFKQALREREFKVAELILKALERLNASCPCEEVLTEAVLLIDDGSRRRPKRSAH
ncbi:hypothetical protein [Mesorhizobium australicum]|uniref:Uncharacterized protein n=1 Tax=Mesorhizobium australicum TaxID=536018 RepID=A0A1X7MMW3_9HYPH|nr:hypothetical protein [Mesorhizobium australicum]SMH26150.1 hypothetical protein SAMN02982922_0049 [Mesorhizobium australicum]